MAKQNNSLSLALYCLSVILFGGCKRETVDISKLVAERDSLILNLSNKQYEIDNLNSLVQVVSEGLDSIAIQERFIRDGGPEGTRLNKEQMKKCLKELAEMLARYRVRVAELEDSLNIDGAGVRGLHNIISYLNEQLAAKEEMINQLRVELNKKNVNIKQMQAELSTMSENIVKLDSTIHIQKDILSIQDSMLNEGYMKVGTKEQLKLDGFLTKGSILKKSALNKNALQPNKCTKIDIRTETVIRLEAKKVKVLTDMPRNSYRIDQNADGTSTLFVDDPTEFWSLSNYLVIMLEE